MELIPPHDLIFFGQFPSAFLYILIYSHPFCIPNISRRPWLETIIGQIHSRICVINIAEEMHHSIQHCYTETPVATPLPPNSLYRSCSSCKISVSDWVARRIGYWLWRDIEVLGREVLWPPPGRVFQIASEPNPEIRDINVFLYVLRPVEARVKKLQETRQIATPDLAASCHLRRMYVSYTRRPP